MSSTYTARLPRPISRWCVDAAFDKPLHWHKPRIVEVRHSMSDLFHDDVPVWFIAEVFAVMALADRHTFQVLTKRPERMARLLRDDQFLDMVLDAAESFWDNGMSCHDGPIEDWNPWVIENWPLPNIWLGVSVEDQRAADERIPLLLQTPAAVRWLSCEPLIGPVDLQKPWPATAPLPGSGSVYAPWMVQQVDWLVCGGESGPNFRPLDLNWARSLRNQCQAAGVPFHFKQVGGKTHSAGGRLLDGRTHDDYPEPRRELMHA